MEFHPRLWWISPNFLGGNAVAKKKAAKKAPKKAAKKAKKK
jgi:hypothetical protein